MMMSLVDIEVLYRDVGLVAESPTKDKSILNFGHRSC